MSSDQRKRCRRDVRICSYVPPKVARYRCSGTYAERLRHQAWPEPVLRAPAAIGMAKSVFHPLVPAVILAVEAVRVAVTDLDAVPCPFGDLRAWHSGVELPGDAGVQGPDHGGPHSCRVGDLTVREILVRLMTMTTMPLAEVKSHLSELVSRVQHHHERVTVTVHGKPSAVLVAVDDLDQLEESLAVMRDMDTLRRLAESDAELERGEEVSTDELAETIRRRQARE
jgi:antitoxin YefM